MLAASVVEYSFVYESPVGCLGVCVESDSIIQASWLTDEDKMNISMLLSASRVANDVHQALIAVLNDYFKSSVMISAELSLHPKGTLFQKRVWQALRAIPFGCTRTYGELARELNTGARAVGQVCRTNNISLFIPCHRVVAANGIGGFMGGYRHVDRKRWLLHHEGII